MCLEKFLENSDMRRKSFLYIVLPFFPILTYLGLPSGFESQQPLQSSLNTKEAAGEPKCMECHSDLLEWKVTHKPAKEGCLVCHKTNPEEHPEKTTKGLFLAEEVPGLCYTCHEDVKKEIDSAKVVHKTVMTDKKCINCHSPHASDEPKLLLSQKNKLCLSCHDKDSTYADGHKTINMKQLLSSSKVIHPAIKGGCGSCHKAHASNENYMLISEFPREKYVIPNSDRFALCWECHDADLYNVAKSTTVTSFRNGDQNLHWVHLKGARGRSCVICHDVHASNNKALIIDKVSFGKWNFDMNFVPSEKGGSCYPGCHEAKTYTRE